MQLIQHHILHILLLNLTNSSLTVIKTIFSLYVYISVVMIWASNEQSLSFSSLYNFINQSMCRKREQNDRTTYIEPTLNERDYNIPGTKSLITVVLETNPPYVWVLKCWQFIFVGCYKKHFERWSWANSSLKAYINIKSVLISAAGDRW
jgi:hypothetical protein